MDSPGMQDVDLDAGDHAALLSSPRTTSNVGRSSSSDARSNAGAAPALQFNNDGSRPRGISIDSIRAPADDLMRKNNVTQETRTQPVSISTTPLKYSSHAPVSPTRLVDLAAKIRDGEPVGNDTSSENIPLRTVRTGDPRSQFSNQVSQGSLVDSLQDSEDAIEFRRKRHHHSKPSWTKAGGLLQRLGVKKAAGFNADHDEATEDEEEDKEWLADTTGRRVVYDNFSTIDWMHDQAKDRIRLTKINALTGWQGEFSKAYDKVQSWILMVMVGIIVGVVTTCISILIDWLSSIKLGYCTSAWYLNKKFCCLYQDNCVDWVPWAGGDDENYPTYVGMACLFAVTSAFLVKTYAPYAAGSGIAECKTILFGFVIRGYLGLTTLMIKSIALIFSVSSGLLVGKEGPLVHISCCIGNILPRFFSKFHENEARKREILSAAVAAGIAVAFGSPIGGVLFSLEEVSYFFPHKTMWRSFFCSLVAVSILQIMNPLRDGNLTSFSVSYNSDWHDFEMLAFILIGICGGLYGALFINCNIRVATFRKTSWLKNWPIAEIFVLALLTSLISFQNIFMRLDSGALLEALFDNCQKDPSLDICTKSSYKHLAFQLLAAVVLKIMLISITFGAKVPAGNFVPSMAIGACLGRLVGMMMQEAQESYPSFPIFMRCTPDQQCVYPGTYAVIGATAFLAGATRMSCTIAISISLTVIMFEITGALGYILPTMITIMVAKQVGDLFGKDSIVDAYITLNRFPFLDSKEEYTHNITSARVMTEKNLLEYFTATEHTFGDVAQVLERTKYKGFPVVYSHTDAALVGYISRAELRYAIDQAKQKQKLSRDAPCRFIGEPRADEDQASELDLRPWMDQTPMTVSHKAPMAIVFDIFRKLGPRYVIVTKSGKLTGVITKKDMLRHMAFLHRFEVHDVQKSQQPAERHRNEQNDRNMEAASEQPALLQRAKSASMSNLRG